MIETQAERLSRLGLNTAAEQVKKAKELKRKLAIAYEHYRFVTQAHIDRFNVKLRETTRKKDGGYHYLSLTPLDEWDKIPPPEVLEALEAAINRKCFDSYEVAHIIEVKDPILFGRVEGAPDRFYVAQWFDDVRIEDILKENEG